MTERISAALELRGKHVHCVRCGQNLGPAERGWKAGSLLREQPMNNAGGAPFKCREHVLLRLFLCPGCGRQLATETAMKDDPFLEDILKVV